MAGFSLLLTDSLVAISTAEGSYFTPLLGVSSGEKVGQSPLLVRWVCQGLVRMSVRL